MTKRIRLHRFTPTPGTSLAFVGTGLALGTLAGMGPIALVACGLAGLGGAVSARTGARMAMSRLEAWADRMDPGGASTFEHP